MQMELVLFFGGCVLVNQMLVIENEKIAITLRLKEQLQLQLPVLRTAIAGAALPPNLSTPNPT